MIGAINRVVNNVYLYFMKQASVTSITLHITDDRLVVIDTHKTLLVIICTTQCLQERIEAVKHRIYNTMTKEENNDLQNI